MAQELVDSGEDPEAIDSNETHPYVQARRQLLRAISW